MPERIQRRRTKGWRMPEGALYVGRPTKWGNPFEAYKSDCCGYWDVRDDNGVTYIIDHASVHRDLDRMRADRSTWTTRSGMHLEAVRLYCDEATYWLGGWKTTRPDLFAALPELAGHDLVCWCPLDLPCHADVLLAIANGGDGDE